MEYLHDYSELLKLFERNNKLTQKKIIEKLKSPPSKTDSEGYVYGFYKKTDINTRFDFYIKLGRTAKEVPQERINEWRGKQVFTILTNYNKKFERLVHLFFNFANVHRMCERFPNKKEIEWFKFERNLQIDMNFIISRIAEINQVLDNIHLRDEVVNESAQVETNSRESAQVETNPRESAQVETNPKESAQIETNKNQSDKVIHRININNCSRRDLERIKGIGKVLAERIILARPFETFQDIEKIKGIGKNKFHIIENSCVI